MFKKIFAVLAACMLAAFAVCGLAGCADNSKELITTSLEEELDQLRNPDDATIADLASNLPTGTFAQLGLDPNDVVRTLLEGFDGTVDNVEVDGKNAEATVTLSSKDFSQIEEAMEAVTDSMAEDPDQFADMSRSEIMEWAGQQIMDTLNGLPVIQHDPTTIEYVLNGNTWEPAPGAEAKLTAAIFG